MKKIALLLVLVLSFGALFACGEEEKVKTAAEVVAEAQEKLGESRTKMVVNYSFVTDNAALQKALNAAMPISETIIDGDNQWAYVKMPNPSGIGAEFIESTTTMIGNKIYVNAAGIKTVTTLDPISLEIKLKEKANEMVDFSEFLTAAADPEMTTDGDKITITFNALKEGKGLDALAPGFDKLLNGGKISLANMKGTLVVNKGNIEKYEISLDITADGETVSCKCEYAITTENVPEVTAPSDADKYTETPNIPGLS